MTQVAKGYFCDDTGLADSARACCTFHDTIN
jgi:hypothetical protein